MHPIDVILLVVTGVLIYRLYMTLGRKPGHDEKLEAPKMTVVEARIVDVKEESETPSLVDQKLLTLKSQDPTFVLEKFILGAQAAFDRIITAFAKGEEEALRPLVSDKLMTLFHDTIEERREQSVVFNTSVLRVASIEVLDGYVKDKRLFVKVQFVSEQTEVVEDTEGKILEGDPDEVHTVTDVWLFSKALKSRNPEWILEETSEMEAA